MSLIHAHAWMHVKDAAAILDNVLGMPAILWLEVLPKDDQTTLAVHFQNEVHAEALWRKSTELHGDNSEQAARTARKLQDVRERKQKSISMCMRRAEVILSSGTSA